MNKKIKSTFLIIIAVVAVGVAVTFAKNATWWPANNPTDDTAASEKEQKETEPIVDPVTEPVPLNNAELIDEVGDIATPKEEEQKIKIINRPEEFPDIKLAPLTHTYTDESNGFSLKYIDKLKIRESGSAIVIGDKYSHGLFGLKIHNAESYYDFGMPFIKSFKSLSDFEVEQKQMREEGYFATKGVTFQYDIPTSNTRLKTKSGVDVLKQVYKVKITDNKGRDITSKVCSHCGTHTRYILFKSPDDFVIISPGRRNDRALEDAIIKSITY